MQRLQIDRPYLERVLLRLLRTPSPTGFTDAAVNLTVNELEALGLHLELTRRGAIRANVPGESNSRQRALIGHLDTLGAIVTSLKENGRLSLAPIGHWSSRFAEGARCNIMTLLGKRIRGTILPLKASGHRYNEEIDTQPVSWDNMEVRLDEHVTSREDVMALPIHVGDYIAIDSSPDICANGFINARHLDDKAGVACMLAAAKAIVDAGITPPIDCHLLFTISEEVGIGASHVLHGDVSEIVSVDNGVFAPGQNTIEYGVTLCMMDMSGPYDWHLNKSLIDLCQEFSIPFARDVFKYYRSDAASALEAGNDIRTALVCFGLDATHGYERVHVDSLLAVASLLAVYMQSPPVLARQQPPGAAIIGTKG